MGRVRRRCGGYRMLARSWEYQARGVLHTHVVLPCGTARERRALDVYMAALRDLVGVYGFGHELDVRRVPAGQAGAYLAKYLAPRDGAGKLSLTETVTRRDVPALVVYVSRDLTGRTMVTMRNLRLRRQAWCIARERSLSLLQVLQALLELPVGQPPAWQLLVGTGFDPAGP